MNEYIRQNTHWLLIIAILAIIILFLLYPAIYPVVHERTFKDITINKGGQITLEDPKTGRIFKFEPCPENQCLFSRTNNNKIIGTPLTITFIAYQNGTSTKCCISACYYGNCQDSCFDKPPEMPQCPAPYIEK